MKLPLSHEDIQILKMQTMQAVEKYMAIYEELDKWDRDLLNGLTGEQSCSKCGKPLEKVRVTGDPNRWKCLKCKDEDKRVRHVISKLKSTA